MVRIKSLRAMKIRRRGGLSTPLGDERSPTHSSYA